MADSEKELALVRQQSSKALAAANDLVISNDEDLNKCVDLLSKIKSVGKMIKERKEAITRPLMESLKSVRELFLPIESNHAEAESLIKVKMLNYQGIQDKKLAVEKAKITARVEKGTLKIETALNKIENLAPTATSVKGKVGSITTRIVRKARIVNESMIPREYLIPNMVAINDAVLKRNITIPGIVVEEEKIISAK